MTPRKNTHKNKAITAFINRFALICLLASTAVLTACGDKESAESRNDFSARPFILDSNLSSQASIANGIEPNAVALRYLRSINFEGYERAGEVFGDVVRGNDFDVSNDRLGADDGLLIIQTRGENRSGGHVFVGRFETTDVGAELALSEATPIATFRGNATVVLVHARNGGLFSASDSYRARMEFTNIELTANFAGNTLTGGEENPDGRALRVNGTFNDKRITGSVTAIFTDNTVRQLASRNDFMSTNLMGLIGEDGAVGTFTNHLPRGNPSDYALGGGFVVKAPPPAANP